MINQIVNKDRDSCFVCELRFKTSLPPGPANKEEHHVFPRNAGGTDGPLVFLCDSHHTTIHKIASRIKSKKEWRDLLAGETQHKKLLWLASCIVKAESLMGDDPNKTYRNGLSLSEPELLMIKRLQTVYPGKSRSDIIRRALSLYYQSHFK